MEANAHKCVNPDFDGYIFRFSSLFCSWCMGRGIDLVMSKEESERMNAEWLDKHPGRTENLQGIRTPRK